MNQQQGDRKARCVSRPRRGRNLGSKRLCRASAKRERTSFFFRKQKPRASARVGGRGRRILQIRKRAPDKRSHDSVAAWGGLSNQPTAGRRHGAPTVPRWSPFAYLFLTSLARFLRACLRGGCADKNVARVTPILATQRGHRISTSSCVLLPHELLPDERGAGCRKAGGGAWWSCCSCARSYCSCGRRPQRSLSGCFRLRCGGGST